MRAVEILEYGQPFYFNDQRTVPELSPGKVLVQVITRRAGDAPAQ